MKKMHSDIKRRLGIGKRKNGLREMNKFRKPRPKTFPTEEAAKKWATTKGIKSYSLKKVKKNKRFEIVPSAKK